MPFCGYLKQSTAVDILIGPFVDDTDGKTAETGLTLDVEVSKNGQALANKNDATTPTHDAAGDVDGYYNCELDTTDTNTLGILTVVAHASGFLPVRQDYQVVTAHWYDTMCSTDYLQVDVIQVEGSDATDQIRDAVVDDSTRIDASQLNTHSAITAASIRTEMDSNSTQLAAIVADTNELQTDDVPGLIAALNDPTAAAIADAVWDEAATGHTDAGKAGQQLWTDVDAILTDTAEIGAAGAGLTAVPWNAAWDAEVQSEVQDAIEANHLDHLLAADYDPASKPGTATALLNELVENDGGVSRFTQNALEQAPSAGTNPNVLVDTTVASVPSQTEFTLTAGSNDDDAYNDQAIVIYDTSDSDYPSVRKISDYTGSTRTVTIDSGPDFTMVTGDGIKIFVTAPGTTAPTAAAVADAVWDEAASGHTTGGTFGEQCGTDVDAILADTDELQTDDIPGALTTIEDKIDTIDTNVDAVLADTGTDGVLLADNAFTAAAVATGGADKIADGVWDEAKSGHVGAGSMGEEVQSHALSIEISALNDPSAAAIRTEIDSNSTQLAAIVADTNELQGDLTDGGRLDLLIDAILADTDELQTDDTPGTLSTIEGKIDTIDTNVDAVLADTGTDGVLLAANALTSTAIATGGRDKIADGVWDEAISGHTTPGSTGAALNSAGSGADADAIADAVWDEAAADHDTEDTFGNVVNDLTEESDGTYRFTTAALAQAPSGSAGSGAITFTYTVTDSGTSNPIADCRVWVTTDQAGINIIAQAYTDANGEATFYLDAGTYYFFRKKSGYIFTNPDTETVA